MPNYKNPSSLSELSLEKMTFPSDSLSIGGLRKMFPNAFDRGFSFDQPSQPRYFLDNGDENENLKVLSNTLKYERILAVHCIAGNLQAFLKRPEGIATASELNKNYISLNLAKGPASSKQLINNLISIAAGYNISL